MSITVLLIHPPIGLHCIAYHNSSLFSTIGSIYAQVNKEREKIIEFLAANVTPDGFATELEIVGLISKDVREEAEVMTITTRKRIRPVMNAVISKLELSEENADKFKSVLKKFMVLDDLIEIIT